MAGVKVDWHFHVTTVDPPQLLTFIRKNYPQVEWTRPAKTMLQLILKHKMLPTRLARYCCAELKEGGGTGRSVLLGVLAEESVKRSRYQMVASCQKRRQHLIRPLLDWKWADVWGFLYAQKIPHCELYDPPYNFKRIGCVGCPMAGRGVWREFRLFPNFKKAYLNTIKKAMANGAFLDHPSPESVLRWWIAGNSAKVFFAKEAQQVFCFDN
jgi:phosphoadenosine phosphosulfate reductase